MSDVFLTLEPRTATGARAPLITFTHRFPGDVLDESVRIDLTVYGNANPKITGIAKDRQTILLRRIATDERVA